MNNNLNKEMSEVFQELQNIHEKKESLDFIKSSFDNLNEIIVGFYYGEVTVLGSRAGMGKSALVNNLILGMSLKEEKSILLFSLEANKKMILKKLLSAEAAVGLEKIKKGTVKDEEWGRIGIATNKLAEAKIFIDDQNGVTVYDIKRKIMKYKEENKLDVVVIDYIQLIEGGENYKGNRQQEVSEIMRELKRIAKELNIVIIALSQLARGSEQRVDRRPIISDLKESSSLEEDADNILLLFREDYYEEESPLRGITEVIVGKQRNGPTGTAILRFFHEILKFADYKEKIF